MEYRVYPLDLSRSDFLCRCGVGMRLYRLIHHLKTLVLIGQVLIVTFQFSVFVYDF